MTDILIDSDVILKLCLYQLRVWEPPEALSSRGLTTLAASRFIIPRRLKRRKLASDRRAITQAWDSFSHAAEFAEPTNAEVEFAAMLEASAQRVGLAFDVGESQLMAMMIKRGANLLLSGDKRAISALPQLVLQHTEISGAVGNVCCVEQLFLDLLECCDPSALRTRVCNEPSADRTLSICFKCAGAVGSADEYREGLSSYLTDLRRNAADILCAARRTLSSAS